MKKMKRITLMVLSVIVVLLVFGIILLKYKTYATKELPKVYITVDDEESFRNMTKEEGERTASLVYDDGSDENFSSYIKIKVQGSTSAQYPKKNYTIKLYEDSEYSQKQKIDMGQGWGNFNKYCLKANWIDDKTHSRNIVTARIAAKVQEKYGLFTDTPNNGVIDGFPVEIYLNGEFLGLYTWNIPKDAWMWNLDEDNPNNIAMEAGMCTDATYFKEEIASVESLGDDESNPECSGWVVETGSETQETVDKLNRLISFVKDSTDEEFKNNFDSYINKDAMLNYLVVQYMAEATDNVAKNMIWVTYDGQIWYPTLYDLDTTYGMHHRGLKLHTNYLWLPEDGYEIETAPNANDSLLLKKVIRCFPDEFAERWFELRKDILSDESILNEFNNFIGEIPETTYELEATTWANSSWNGKNWEEIPGFNFGQIKQFLNERLPFVDEIMYNKYTDNKSASLSIKYSTTNPTNGNVKATVVANRNDITFGTNATVYTFSSNGTYTFKATDGGGNDVIATATVDWIDKIAPTLVLDYSSNEITNKNIKVTITANEEIQEVEGWILSENKKDLIKTYATNDSEIVEVYDIAGNKSEVQVSVNNIDKTAPQIDIKYSITEMTNEDINVVITANEEIQEVEGWILSENKKDLTKTYTNNDSEIVEVYDIAGNKSEIQVSIENIDKIAPEVEVKYSITGATKEDIEVIITANEEIQEVEDWVLSEDKLSLTKTYNQNIQETIEILDLVGNITKVDIDLMNIDKYEPELTLNYSETEMTKDDVIVKITANEQVQAVSGWELSEDRKILTKIYTTNDSETVTVYDLTGNESTVQVSVNNIDKIAPEVEVKSSKTGITNEDIIVTLTANEEIQEVEGWKISEDKLTLTKTYSKNIQETIEVLDLVGNTTQVDINLINIDKTKPTIKLDYSETEITNGNVVVIITSNEEMQEVNSWTLSEDKKILTKTYEKNEHEIIEIKDLAGNITNIEIIVSNIDKVLPEIKVEYSNIKMTNKDVTVKITANEEIQEVNGWKLSEDRKILTKLYEKNAQEIIEIKDLAGNTVEKHINISNIDKEKPIVEVKYSSMNGTDEYAKIKIISNEKLQKVEGWELSEDKITLTKTYKENVQETIEIKDLAGNITLVKINIDNIESSETDKNPITEKDNSIAIGILPDAGISRIIIIAIVVLSISLGVTIFKLKKYKGI